MSSYIAPEYETVEEMLKPFIKEHALDEITVNSLIRGSMEILDSELPMASVAVINVGDLCSAASIKPKNIKINLKFALNSIFSFKTICGTQDLWLVLSIVKTIVFLVQDMTIQLSMHESIVLFALYRLQSATSREIIAYLSKLKEIDCNVDTQSVNDALNNLEKIGTIMMEDGKYCICETIVIRKS